MFKKILVPFDGFGLADGILRFIPQLAKGFDSSVILLWVMTPNGTRSSSALTVVELEEAARQLSLEVGEAIPMVTVGSPAATIVRVASEEGCDLIAMATHGRGTISRGLLGSVSDDVVRNSPIPTMVFAPGKADKDWSETTEIDRIIVPLDGTDYAETALPYAEEMARRLDLEIILIRVNYREGVYSLGVAGVPAFPEDPNVQIRDEGYLKKVTGQLQRKGLQVRWEWLKGSPPHRTAGFARKTHGSMIVLATKGHSGIERLIGGSVSELAVVESGDPVLIISPVEE